MHALRRVVQGPAAWLLAVGVLWQHGAQTVVRAQSLAIRSPAFADAALMPAANTCDGTAGSPALEFTGVPPDTRSLAVIVEDPDVPGILQSDGMFVHWVRWDIPPDTQGIPQGGASGGFNEMGSGYADPCPPVTEHRYVFRLFALDTTFGPDAAFSSADDLYDAMNGHILAQAQTVGRYQRPFGQTVIMFAVLGVLLLVVVGILYGAYRGLRFFIRRMA